jgi:hypothetical protein
MRRFVGVSSLAALLATAALGPLSPGAQAAEAPPGTKTYLVKADLNGRSTPKKSDVALEDFLEKGERVPIECQTYGGSAYGSRLWNLVSREGETLFVPDHFIRTGTDGRSPDIRACDGDDFDSVTDPVDPFPPSHP